MSCYLVNPETFGVLEYVKNMGGLSRELLKESFRTVQVSELVFLNARNVEHVYGLARAFGEKDGCLNAGEWIDQSLRSIDTFYKEETAVKGKRAVTDLPYLFGIIENLYYQSCDLLEDGSDEMLARLEKLKNEVASIYISSQDTYAWGV